MILSIRRALLAWYIASLETEHDISREMLHDAAERASKLRERIALARQRLATLGKYQPSVHQLRPR